MRADTFPEEHPNLSPMLNKQVAETAINGGADLRKLEIGRVLQVRTQNTDYEIKRVHEGDTNYPFTMKGHPRICPTPTRVAISGSSYDGAMLRIGFIGRGMNIEFMTRDDGRWYTSSGVVEVVERSADDSNNGTTAGDR